MKIFKKIIVWMVFVIFLISVFVNISNQLTILIQAKQKNTNLKNEIKELSQNNRKLQKQIEYATSSAFIEESLRNNFGLGTENDYWIHSSVFTQ